MSLVNYDQKLIGNLQKYCQSTFGINPSEFNAILNYDCFQWRRKFKPADWFYDEIHLHLSLPWKKSAFKTGTKKRNRPLDFEWLRKRPVKKEKKSSK